MSSIRFRISSLFLIGFLFFQTGIVYAVSGKNVPQSDWITTENSGNIPSTFSQPSENFSYPYKKNFLVSAYYTPVPGQQKYALGSLEADIRMNGDTVSANGTTVYPGMIAAPKIFPFGTKLKIPGFGIGTVHDRGGAIVQAGQQGNLYDRLDVWMGFGDTGLQRALQWGKRVVEVTVYGKNVTIKDNFVLKDYFQSEASLKEKFMFPVKNSINKAKVLESTFVSIVEAQPLPSNFQFDPPFQQDLKLGDSGDNVKKLQEELVRFHLLGTQPTGYYGEVTEHAVFKFQQIQLILKDKSSPGAGFFGPQTRRAMNALMEARSRVEALKQQAKKF